MRRFFRNGLAGMLCAVLLTTGALVTRAQDSGGEPVIVGDAGNEALGLVRQFLEDGSIDVLAEDVTYFDRTLPEPIVGRDAFVGLGIGETEYWSKGYGTDVMNVLLRFAFTEINLKRVTLTVFEYNPRAVRSYEKAGFRHEGRLRDLLYREGRRWDNLFMGILREEWLELNAETVEATARA